MFHCEVTMCFASRRMIRFSPKLFYYVQCCQCFHIPACDLFWIDSGPVAHGTVTASRGVTPPCSALRLNIATYQIKSFLFCKSQQRSVFLGQLKLIAQTQNLLILTCQCSWILFTKFLQLSSLQHQSSQVENRRPFESQCWSVHQHLGGGCGSGMSETQIYTSVLHMSRITKNLKAKWTASQWAV